MIARGASFHETVFMSGPSGAVSDTLAPACATRVGEKVFSPPRGEAPRATGGVSDFMVLRGVTVERRGHGAMRSQSGSDALVRVLGVAVVGLFTTRGG